MLDIFGLRSEIGEATIFEAFFGEFGNPGREENEGASHWHMIPDRFVLDSVPCRG